MIRLATITSSEFRFVDSRVILYVSLQILLGLSDSELEAALRLESVLHRRKLRLAIEELRDPSIV
jgi:hypothetical protein